jgi:hypothetical protein
VRAALARLARGVEGREVSAWNTLRLDGARDEALKNVSASLQVERIGFSNDGSRALARFALLVAGSRGDQSKLVARGTQDLALVRGGAGWEAAAPAWKVADPTLDALQDLVDAAAREWTAVLQERQEARGDGGTVRPISGGRDDSVLHLVAERRGGHWVALRRSVWGGRVLSPRALATRENATERAAAGTAGANGTRNAATQGGGQAGAQNGSAQWLAAQLHRWASVGDGRGGGTLHLLLQNGARDWVGLDGVWEPRLSQTAPNSPKTRRASGTATPNVREEGEPAPFSLAAERAAASARREVGGDPILFGDAGAHRRLAQVLEGAGLFGEAADEWEKSSLLVPALAPPSARVSATQLRGAQERRAWDPRARAIEQLEDERRVGLDNAHPTTIISLLEKSDRVAPALKYLRLGLEHSKLGEDTIASAYLQRAQDRLRQGAWAKLSPDDVAWAEVLSEHLEQRRLLAPIKPPNHLRSDLFTVRCRLDEAATLPVLAALEAAQHTVYADFRVPMGATEVVLWKTQKEFQDYTTRFSAHGGSEFVAALTLTKLIATSEGPLVLGEEINAFVDERLADATFGTVAHEYGHVAVRQMSRGRAVPVWFNEGVATVVEGGYEGAVERVRTAKKSNRLLSMAALQAWSVDGERAFLAYSQANSMVDFMIERWGAPKVLEILRQIGANVAPEQAFRNVLGVSTAQLWQAWAREGIR